jgi:geranylgeranyl diphosphate synthase, type I
MKKNSNKLKDVLFDFRKTVDPIIKEILTSDVDKERQKIVEYQVSTGGKRLRPALAIICNQLLGGQKKDALYPAAGLEILHNYSLIIDDIIDRSRNRREKPTTWYKLGKATAQCLSIYYAAAIFQAANHSKQPTEISEIFAKTMKIITGGEISDILFEMTERKRESYLEKNRYQTISKKGYLKMIEQKTAILFQSCCQVGALSAGAKKKEIEALKKYGFNLGIAFQIQDDILDIFGEKESHNEKRKEIGKDIIERKGGNIVVILALEKLKPKHKKKLNKLMEKEYIKKKEVTQIVEIFKKTGSYEKSQQLGKKFVKKAKKNLASLPQNKWNDILKETADFIIKREK